MSENQIQKFDNSGPFGVYQKIVDPISATEKLGEMIAFSGLFGCTKKEQGQVLALQCIVEGKPPLELQKTYHMIDGKLSMKSDAMLAKYQMSGGRVKWVTRTPEKVVAVFSHRDQDIEIAYTMAELVESGVATGKDGKLKENYRKFPRQMLTARCISEGVRLLAPEIVFGIYTPEEVSDFAESGPAVVTKVAEPKPEIVVTPEFSLVERLEQALEAVEEKANKYLLTKGAIQEGQSFRDLKPSLAEKILADPAAWVAKVEKEVVL
jgi:hypothetical protein